MTTRKDSCGSGGKALSEYLFWLELLSLSGELTVAIHNGLRKSAKKLVEKPEDAAELEKQLDDLVENGQLSRRQADEAIDELTKAAELDMRQVDLFPGGSQFEVLSSNLLKKYIRELDLKMLKHNLKLEIVWIDETHNMYLTGLKGRVMVYESGPIKLLIRKNCPKMAWFHENVHIDDLLKLGRKNYRKMVAEKPWELEWNVWEEIYKTKNKYREEELVSAYKYVKYFFKENKQPFLENQEMEKLILKYSD